MGPQLRPSSQPQTGCQSAEARLPQTLGPGRRASGCALACATRLQCRLGGEHGAPLGVPRCSPGSHRVAAPGVTPTAQRPRFQAGISALPWENLLTPSSTFQHLPGLGSVLPVCPTALSALKFCEVHSLDINVLFIMTVHTFTRCPVHATDTVEKRSTVQQLGSCPSPPPPPPKVRLVRRGPRSPSSACSASLSCVLSESCCPRRLRPYCLRDRTSPPE